MNLFNILSSVVRQKKNAILQPRRTSRVIGIVLVHLWMICQSCEKCAQRGGCSVPREFSVATWFSDPPDLLIIVGCLSRFVSSKAIIFTTQGHAGG